jgi:hypothetical protein
VPYVQPAVTPPNETHDLIAVRTLVLCCVQDVLLNAVSLLVPGGLAVQHVQPARVTQYIRTQLTVVLNGSLCEQLGQVRGLLTFNWYQDLRVQHVSLHGFVSA